MTAAALLAEAAATLAAAGVRGARVGRRAPPAPRPRLGPGDAPREPRTRRCPSRKRSASARSCRRRASREPLQYILGTQAFWKHEFLVTPDVLIPRPETELLVETSLELLKGVERPRDRRRRHGLAAASRSRSPPSGPTPSVHATDVSEPALEVARENARRLGLEGRVAFHRGELLEPVSGLEGGSTSSSATRRTSTPPSATRSRRRCATTSRGWRSSRPGDALSVYRRLVPAARACCCGAGGALAVEISPFIAGRRGPALRRGRLRGRAVRPRPRRPRPASSSAASASRRRLDCRGCVE